MTRQSASTRPGSATPETSHGRLHRLGWQLGWSSLILVIAILSGLPAAIAQHFISLGIADLATHTSGNSIVSARAFATGMTVALVVTTNILILVFLPLAWRRISSPRRLRTLAYIAIQLWAVSIGLILPDPTIAFIITLDLAGAGSTAWWVWQKKWRGAGVAPSPLAGVLRPDLHTGQIWYAVIAGRNATKVRPVIIIAPASQGRWDVAYLTTQQPPAHLTQHYIPVPEGALRGLPKGNWVSLRDPRTLKPSQFRTYTGLTPTWLYTTTAERLTLPADPHAFTIDEEHAGETMGPIEHTLRHMFALHDDDTQARVASSRNFRALLKLRLTPPVPKRSKTPPPADKP